VFHLHQHVGGYDVASNPLAAEGKKRKIEEIACSQSNHILAGSLQNPALRPSLAWPDCTGSYNL